MKKLVLLAVLLLCGFAAWKLGYAGKALGYARTQADPEDKALAQYFSPQDADVAVAVRAPLVFPTTETKLDGKWRDLRDEVKRVSGVRLELDVDAVVAGPRLVVVRGRFDWSRMSEPLQAAGYKITNLEGVPVALKSSGEALAVDGNYALLGTLEGIERALAERKAGSDPRKGAFGYVKEVGWRHVAVGAVVLSKEQAGFAQLLQGSAAPRAAAFAIDRVEQGTQLEVVLDAGSIPSAREIEASIKGARAQLVEQLKQKPQDPASVEAAKMLTEMTIAADDQARVRMGLVVPDTLARLLIEESSKGQGAAQQNAAAMSAISTFMSGLQAR